MPDFVTVMPGQEGVGDEGTAMLEIVHDLAPGADLYFATARGGMAQFAANIEALCEAGANVIVDDIVYPAGEAAFQDDVIAQGINAAVANGCYYFSAAGNAGNLNDGTSGTWQGDFVPAGEFTAQDGSALGTAHDFGGSGRGNLITSGSSIGYVLHWSDPLGASTNDYDLFVIDSSGEVLVSSTTTQDGTQDPIEFIRGGFVEGARLVVVKTDGAQDRYLRVAAIAGRLAAATSGATWGHSAAANAIGVAAVDVSTAGGAGRVFDGSESVETFSSDGPRRLFFEPDGTQITPGDISSTGGRLLQKPDLAAADNVSTSTPGFFAFKGTSAAAPHVAAMAALILEAAGGPARVKLAALRSAMASSALDIEAPGVDRDSGSGIVVAAKAVGSTAVVDRNRPPVAVGVLEALTLSPTGGEAVLDVAGAFADPDGDELAFSAFSSAPERVAASLSGSLLTVMPLVPGHAIVTVHATDPDGLRGTQRLTVAVSAGTRDYDRDDDNLIEVGNLAQLDAIRYDLNADGLVDGAVWRPYYRAFRSGALGMGCPAGCRGYELTADLSFDTNGNGRVGPGDTYWNGGAGWEPIGVFAGGTWFRPQGRPFKGAFDGNGHIVSNLLVARPSQNGVGLFGYASGLIRGVGLEYVHVTGNDSVGALVGLGRVRVENSSATGQVWGRDFVGGMAGGFVRGVTRSWTSVQVSATGNAVGGLGGFLDFVQSSYATGSVSGTHSVGGLVGVSVDLILSSYATGSVVGRGLLYSESESCSRYSGVGGAGRPCLRLRFAQHRHRSGLGRACSRRTGRQRGPAHQSPAELLGRGDVGRSRGCRNR